MRELRPTPPQPVFYGQIHFGVFREPFRTLNLVDADVYGHRWAPRWWRNLRLKEWQHFGIVHDDFYCGLTAFDAKFMGISFCYVYDRHSRQIIEHNRTTFSRSAIHIPEQLWHDDGFFRQPGYQIQIHNRLAEGHHHLQIDIQAHHHLPPIHAEFIVHENLADCQPLIAVLPVNDHRRPMYTHKIACPVEGQLEVGERSWVLSRNQHWALVDVQKTFYPHNSFWKWATFAGMDQDGVPVAINLTHNMIRDDDRWNECCAWVDGRLSLFSAARFEYDPAAIQHPWRIYTTDGRVELTFTPEGERADRINLAGVVTSDFHQPFGTYQGYFVDDGGQGHTIDRVFGIAEHHIFKA
ncbi:MAG: DUF2804 domain-containing protein [Chloroflexi bacterium]|nr:DUF2804 domain-containing protein [Chloroflexota bacterium]